MSKVRKLATAKTNGQLPALHPHAAGIDIGATHLQAAVPHDADPKPVRTFTTFTDDLLKLCDWLKACGVRTVAMESTGVYWITGGRILSAKTRDVKSRAAEALRLAANALWRSKTYLGDCFRRWKARLGTPKAITAMAHKLARIIWHLIKYQEPYDPTVWAKAEEKNRQKKIKRLEKTPLPSASNSSPPHKLTTLVSQEAAVCSSSETPVAKY